MISFNHQRFLRHELANKTGYLQLVNCKDFPVPCIEYKISDNFRYQGIMSKELPKYLKFCAKNGYNILIAIVLDNNIPSIKLLKKNNFVLIKTFNNQQVFIWFNNLNNQQLEQLIN